MNDWQPSEWLIERMVGHFEDLKEAIRQQAIAEFPDGIVIHTWRRHYENRRLPLRLADL